MRRVDAQLAAREAALRDRVRDVYFAFRGYPLRADLGEDAYAPNAVDVRVLRADSLHRLPASAFQGYLMRAVTTWGDADDFKRFVPRILELITTEPAVTVSDGIEVWLACGKLEYAGWRHWPARERDAIAAYLDALWAVVLARPIDLSEDAWRLMTLVDWLNAFAEGGVDLAPLLERWRAESNAAEGTATAAAHLAFALRQAPASLQKRGRLDWRPLDGSREHERQTLDWIVSADAVRTLEGAFFRWPDSPYAPMISAAHDWLAAWRPPDEVDAPR